jgi:hypothetical protein
MKCCWPLMRTILNMVHLPIKLTACQSPWYRYADQHPSTYPCHGCFKSRKHLACTMYCFLHVHLLTFFVFCYASCRLITLERPVLSALKPQLLEKKYVISLVYTNFTKMYESLSLQLKKHFVVCFIINHKHLIALFILLVQCIDPWLSRKTSCPICKSSITSWFCTIEFRCFNHDDASF